MLMNNFLRDRKSVREFRDKKVDSKTLDKVQESINLVLEEAKGENIGLSLYMDGKNIYEELKDIGGYSGIMIKSPHYIGLELKDSQDRTQIYGAYYTEKLITSINKLGLEACWVTLSHVDKEKRNSVFGNTGGETDYILSIGYPPRRNPFAIEKPTSARHGVEEIVFKDQIENPISMDELETRALDDLFYYIRFAPSSRNSQPWRFLLEKNKVTLLLAYTEEKDLTLVDAGVIMYYFEEMIKSLGISRTWKLIDGSFEGKKSKYKYIAEFKI